MKLLQTLRHPAPRALKTAATVLLCVLIVVLPAASCARQNNQARVKAAQKLSGGFSCTASIAYNGVNYVVKLTRPSPGLCTMSFVKPDELSALSFNLTADGLKVKYGVFSASVDPSSLPQAAIFNAVLGALNASTSEQGVHVAATNGGGLSISGKTAAGSYTLLLDRNLTPLSLTFSDLKMSLRFSDFQYT